jgi:hypothetical protein
VNQNTLIISLCLGQFSYEGRWGASPSPYYLHGRILDVIPEIIQSLLEQKFTEAYYFCTKVGYWKSANFATCGEIVIVMARLLHMTIFCASRYWFFYLWKIWCRNVQCSFCKQHMTGYWPTYLVYHVTFRSQNEQEISRNLLDENTPIIWWPFHTNLAKFPILNNWNKPGI